MTATLVVVETTAVGAESEVADEVTETQVCCCLVEPTWRTKYRPTTSYSLMARQPSMVNTNISIGLLR